MPPVRRLTAILAADVAGYSRLMGADEEGTDDNAQASSCGARQVSLSRIELRGGKV